MLSIDRVVIADLRNNIVCRGGIWYFGKHEALKPKRGPYILRGKWQN